MNKDNHTEWTVFHEDLKLAGSTIDVVFENENGDLLLLILIYDWKRCKEVVKTSGCRQLQLLTLRIHL